MKITGETKLFLGILVGTVAIIGIAIFLFSSPTKITTYSRDDLIPQSAHGKGNPSAKTFLVEFSDYQCPSCKAVQPILNQILKKYPDTLYFVYRHYPLEQHKEALPAAKLSEAAAIQGKFWEMHDLLFENQDRLSTELWKELITKSELDEKKIQADMESGEVTSIIDADLSAGIRFGVRGTPTFYLNGIIMEFATFDELTHLIDQKITEDNK